MISPPRWLVALSVIVCAIVLVAACGDRKTVINNNPIAPSAPLGSPTAGRTAITFRVNGNALSVRVRYSAPADGLTQVVTALPFNTGFTTAASSVFLTLEATPISYQTTGIGVFFPFLSVQIVVNDQVFREATSEDSSFQTLAVSGTWRQ